jgi:glycosyltransferase involved in cell wall biosynthesis
MRPSNLKPQLVPRVVLVHPGKHYHFYQIALAASQAGILERFLTATYYLPEKFPYSWIEKMPRTWIRRLRERLVARRSMPGVSPSEVDSFPWFEAALSGISHTPGLRSLIGPQQTVESKNALFDRWAARRLRSQHATIVHGVYCGAWKTFVEAKRLGLITVLDAASSPLTDSFVESEYGRGDGMFRPSRRERSEVALADYVFSPSEFVSSGIQAMGYPAERIFLIRYGVETSRFTPTPGRSDGGLRLLFVGNFGLRKGVQYLLEAMRGLQLPGVTLTLIGRPSDRESEQLLVRYAGLFTWIPHASYHELHRWYQSSDVFILPSLAEGSALVTYEAMACALPLIVTANCGSLVRDGVDGLVVPIRDALAIREKIRLLYHDSELRRRLGAAARATADEHSWAFYRSRILSAYHQILDRASALP